MYESNKRKLDDAINSLLEEIESTPKGTDEYRRMVDDLQILYKLRTEQDKNEGEEHIKENQLKENVKCRKIGNIMEGLSLGSGIAMFFTGLHFEKTGRICSDFVRKLIPNFAKSIKR